MEASPGGGAYAYVERLREAHQPTFSRGRDGGAVYSGCSCGNLDGIPYLFAHIDGLRRSYEMKVEELGRETLRASQLAERVGEWEGTPREPTDAMVEAAAGRWLRCSAKC
jgi:hypothetical protein